MTSRNPVSHWFQSALIETSSPGEPTWQRNVQIKVEHGLIVEIQSDIECPGDSCNIGIAVPAMPNVHSHAFQRGFSGLSEFRTVAKDSFWTWRNLMYDFVSRLSPDDVFIIARQLYLEMIEAGYSWVGEFHYLHNDPQGKAYVDPAEMSTALIRAAKETGIGLCLIPVIYQRSGFKKSAVEPQQRRFALDLESFQRLLNSCRSHLENVPNSRLAMAVHSLRAVSHNSISAILEYRSAELPDCPFHIHAAEQQQEVEDCLSSIGQRPIEFLISHFDVDQHWCMIHATHMTPDETQRLATTSAIAGLCPTTEANLGDGIFPAAAYLDHGGTIAIGSDSHCSVDMREELRWLEYGQRLHTYQRAVLSSNDQSTGRRLYSAALAGGAKAIGIPTGRLAVGQRADWIVIDDRHPTIAGALEDRALDRFLFSNCGNPIIKRVLGGRVIEDEQLRQQMRQSSEAFYKLNQRFFS